MMDRRSGSGFKRTAEDIIEQAEKEAEAIITRGKEKADEILGEARIQAEKFIKGTAGEEKTLQGKTKGTVEVPEKKIYALSEEKSDSVVIHCSDSRFQEAFRLFLAEELNLKAYDSLIVPGASQLLMFSNSLPKFATALLRSLKFLMKEHDLKNVIVIMHEDCAWYHRFVPTFLEMRGGVKDRQIQDMVATKRLLEEEFAGVDVRMFYAAITPEKKVEFSEILEKR